jgi:hypothetical protein
MRHKYGKMIYQEIQTCLTPNKLSYVCPENLSMLTYNPNEHCELN